MSTGAQAVPIQGGESELPRRIKELIGDEPQRAFARRCGISDGALRDYLAGSSVPGLAAAKSIADAGGVLIDWLVTGRPPRSRADLVPPDQPPLDPALLQEVVTVFFDFIEENKARVRIDRAKWGDVLVILYQIAAAAGKADKPELERVLRVAA